MATHKAFVLGLFALVSLTGVGATDEKQKGAVIRTQRSIFKEAYDRLAPVHICGKIVDLEGSPVPEAAVKISWSRAYFLNGVPDNPTDTWITSDVRGEWSFSLDNPDCIYVMGATKEGYEFVSSEYVSQDLVSLYHKTKGAPVVVQLRKKGEETFLIVNPSTNAGSAKLLWTVSSRPDHYSLDLLASVGKTKIPPGKRYSDLQVEVFFNTTGRCWTVVYRTTNETDGVIGSDKLMYVAPETGYQKEVVLQKAAAFHNPMETELYLYLRTRKPAIYSRILLKHDVWLEPDTGENFRIMYNSWINPFGERSLEYDQRMEQNWRIEKEITEEAKAAIEIGRLPPKPNILQRIKEMNERPRP